MINELEDLAVSSRGMRDARFRIGSILGGRYELRRVLGRGGGAWVFAAEHLHTSRSVALKLPHTETEHGDVLFARLRRELHALGKVRHAAVVDVVDGGDIDGLPFIAMQLVEGRTLSSLIAARTRLEPDEVVKIGLEATAGLTAVHAANIVHRDLKPSNVIITCDAQNQVRIVDFGTAKLLDDDDSIDGKLTQNGGILGTLEYMAPEMLLPSSPADARADVYSLGVTLFECLTGVVPCEGPLGRILMKLASGETPSVRDARPDAPRSLAEVIERCLKKDPHERFGSMAEVGSALARLASRSPSDVDSLRPTRRNDVPSQASDQPLPESRREHPRAPYITLARLTRERSKPVDGRVEDISEGGVLIVAEEACGPGEVVRLRVPLPLSGRVIEVAVHTQWTRAARGLHVVGFEFANLPAAARDDIRKYVSLMTTPRRGSLAPDPSRPGIPAR